MRQHSIVNAKTKKNQKTKNNKYIQCLMKRNTFIFVGICIFFTLAKVLQLRRESSSSTIQARSPEHFFIHKIPNVTKQIIIVFLFVLFFNKWKRFEPNYRQTVSRAMTPSAMPDTSARAILCVDCKEASRTITFYKLVRCRNKFSFSITRAKYATT